MQDPTVSSSAWPQSSWQPSSSLGQAGMRTSLSSWRQSQPPYDSLLNRNDSGYSSAGGYLSDSLGRTFRRRDYQGPTGKKNYAILFKKKHSINSAPRTYCKSLSLLHAKDLNAVQFFKFSFSP